MLDRLFENDDLAKARKSLLTAAILTLFLSNVQFITNELSVFGLKVLVDRERLVGLGQLVVTILVTVFVLRSLPVLWLGWLEIQRATVDKHKARDREKIMDRWGLNVPSPKEDGPEGDLESHNEHFEYLREKLEAFGAKGAAFIKSVIALILDWGIPLAASWLALFYPESMSDAVTWIISESANP